VSEPRTIKKYPNRRLYDTEISSYITLDDVRQLVIEHTPFTVIDARSKKDITRSILLQIIFEREEDGEPIFSTEMLESIVRFYGDELQSAMSSYFEQSLRLFVEQQQALRDQMGQVMSGTDPFTMMRNMTEHNMNVWRGFQESMFRGTPRKSGESADSSKEK